MPYDSSVACDSRPDVEDLGRLAHHARARRRSVAIRARRSASPGRVRGVTLVHVAEHDPLELSQRHRARAGGRRSGIGSGPGTIRTPWWIGGRKLLSQTWLPAYGMCSQSTT